MIQKPEEMEGWMAWCGKTMSRFGMTQQHEPLWAVVLALDLVYGPPKFDLLVQFNSSQ